MHALFRRFASSNCQSEQSSYAWTALTADLRHSRAIVRINQSFASYDKRSSLLPSARTASRLISSIRPCIFGALASGSKRRRLSRAAIDRVGGNDRRQLRAALLGNHGTQNASNLPVSK